MSATVLSSGRMVTFHPMTSGRGQAKPAAEAVPLYCFKFWFSSYKLGGVPVVLNWRTLLLTDCQDGAAKSENRFRGIMWFDFVRFTLRCCHLIIDKIKKLSKTLLGTSTGVFWCCLPTISRWVQQDVEKARCNFLRTIRIENKARLVVGNSNSLPSKLRQSR